MKYRQLRGSFNTGMRLEAGFALLVSRLMNYITNSTDYTIHDFMPHNPAPEPTVEEAMKSWG